MDLTLKIILSVIYQLTINLVILIFSMFQIMSEKKTPKFEINHLFTFLVCYI